ncbi:MAG TPA: hypothetical protein VI431_04580 [Candidatus Acidoferrum sp.]
MESCPTNGKSRDILKSPWLTFALFWLPGIAIAITAGIHIGNSSVWRTIVWTPALVIMGAACLVNAARCGRLHCYLTGPFFLLMAIASLLYGLGALPLGRNGWSPLGLTILVGAIALCCLPELFWGKYRKGHVQGSDS